jgi:hypothetical protein
MTLSYELSKKLKEFLGPTFPIPIHGDWWGRVGETPVLVGFASEYPAYTLEDLLSKPFCYEIWRRGMVYRVPYKISEIINEAYYEGGIPAVEAELLRLMSSK